MSLATINGVAAARLLAIVIAIGAGAPAAWAQIFTADGNFIAVNDDDEDEDNGSRTGITPSAADGRYLALSEELDRYLRHQKWPEAFAVLNAMDELKEDGFAEWEGVYRPWREAVLLRLLDLPPAGREAYRLFNEPRAAAAAEKVANETGAAALNSLARKWFLTTTGARLADRAAVAAYREGQFLRAARWWQLLRRHHPADSATEAARLLRQSFALTRAGAFEAASAAISSGRSLMTIPVTVAGRESPLQEALPEIPPTADASFPADVAIAPEPLWHYAFFDTALLDSEAKLSSHNLQRAILAIDYSVPGAAITKDTAVIDWRHALFGLDLETGRLRWRDVRLSRIFDARQTYRIIQYNPGPSATLIGDQILTTVRRSETRPQGAYALSQVDAKSGKTIWSGEKISELARFRPITNWIVTASGDAICAGYQQTSEPTLALVRIPAASLSGKSAKPAPIIRELAPLTMASNQRQNLSGKITAVGGQYYAAISTGQLAGIDGATMDLLWVTDTAEIQAGPQISSYYYRYGQQPTETTDLIPRPESLIVKQPRSTRITAVNPLDGRPIWQRPCLADSQLLAHADDQFILSADGGISAISAINGALLWHAPMPADFSQTQPVITKTRILVLTQRGLVTLDRRTGDRLSLVRGHDVGAKAAGLILHGDRLLAITAAGVTAYAVSPDTGATQ